MLVAAHCRRNGLCACVCADRRRSPGQLLGVGRVTSALGCATAAKADHGRGTGVVGAIRARVLRRMRGKWSGGGRAGSSVQHWVGESRVKRAALGGGEQGQACIRHYSSSGVMTAAAAKGALAAGEGA
eukprot:351852-Chlamydomonas_euryale.AAC.4